MQSVGQFLRAACSVEIPEDMINGYFDAVAILKKRCVGHAPHIRPCAKSTGGLNRTAAKGLLVRPPSDRLVPESLCPREHMKQAQSAEFPHEHDLASLLPQDLVDAVRYTVKNRTRLSGWRNGQKMALCEAAHALLPLDAFIKEKANPPKNVESSSRRSILP